MKGAIQGLLLAAALVAVCISSGWAVAVAFSISRDALHRRAEANGAGRYIVVDGEAVFKWNDELEGER